MYKKVKVKGSKDRRKEKKVDQSRTSVKTKSRTLLMVGLAVVISVGFFLFYNNLLFAENVPKENLASNQSPIVQKVPISGRTHVPEGTKVTYNSNPPTSGAHWPEPARWGFYDKPLPDEILVHNLEHGGIWISYKDIDKETKSKLKSIAEKYPQAVVVTPRLQNDAKIVLASWGRLLKLDVFNEELIISFIKSNVNNAPEPEASI